MADIKTAVSEAVTNAIVHGYRGREDGLVHMSAEYGDRRLLTVVIRDEGCGIADVEKAMQPSIPPATVRSAAAWAFA